MGYFKNDFEFEKMMNSPAIFSDDMQSLSIKDSSEDDADVEGALNIKLNENDFNNVNNKL